MENTSPLNDRPPKAGRYYNLFTLSVVLAPILCQYVSFIPGVSSADVFLGFSFFMALFFNKPTFSIPKFIRPLLILWFFGMFASVLSFTFQQTINFLIFSRIVRANFYFFLVVASSKMFQLNFAKKIYKPLAIIISFYILIQYLAFQYLNVFLPFKILPIALFRDINIEELFNLASGSYFRPYGVFVEPGYVALYLVPGLAFSLFGWDDSNKKLDLLGSLVIFLALVFSTSTQGFFIGFFLVLTYCLVFLLRIRKSKYLLRSFALLFFAVAIFFASLNLGFFHMATNKININTLQAGMGSSLRILRGPYLFLQMPLLFKVIGVGHGNLGSFVVANSISTPYEPQNMTKIAYDFANGNSLVILYYGLFGLFSVLFLYWSIIWKTEGAFKIIAIIFLLINFVDGAWFNIGMVFDLSLIFSGFNLSSRSTFGKRGKLLNCTCCSKRFF